MLKKAVCLVSGGLDSCVASFIAKEKYDEIFALSIDYGQLHGKELESSKKIVKALQAKRHIILKLDLNFFKNSALLGENSDSIAENKIEDIGSEIPSTYVPARNTIFLSIALGYAESIDADSIYIGANAVDYSGYPDCRPKYIQAYQKMANLATKRAIKGNQIKIEAPLLYMTKSDIIKKGLELKAPLECTWSCYKGKDKACGKCDSCQLRLKGFKEVEKKDQIDYEYLPDWYKN